jgi:branched-chain amino acid transport system permease protein
VIAYLVDLGQLIAIFGLLAASLNLLVGYAGLFSVAHAVFFGLGAYTAAHLALAVSPDLLLDVCAAALLSGGVSLVFALPALRVRGEYLVIASLGLQMLASAVFTEATPLTGGYGGMVGIPLPSVLGWPLASRGAFLAAALVLLAAAQGMMGRLLRGSFGRSLMAIRDAESAAESLGKNVALIKTLAVALGAGLAGAAGALFAFQESFVNVESFTLDQSVFILAMVIVGGAGTLAGPLAGAALLLLLPAALSFIPHLPPTEIGAVQQLLYGLAMTLLMIFRPNGILGRRGVGE